MSCKCALIVLPVLAGLAACGDTTGERALFGGGAGALAATAVDANPLLGAAIGASANILYCEENPAGC